MQKWVDSGIIDWAHWICHQPESDEKKEHFHLVVMPARALDTNDLCKMTYEVDTTKENAILCCQPWRFSKLDDWLLYCLHDRGYLAAKGQERDLHYTLSDMQSTSRDLLEEQYRQLDLRKYGLGERLSEMAKSGKHWEEVLLSGLIPWAQVRYWKEVYHAMYFRDVGTPPF